MLVWRICERADALNRSGERDAAAGGRWSRPGERVVYTSSTAQLAAREADTGFGHPAPGDDPVLVQITLPDDHALYERLQPHDLPAGWDAQPPSEAARDLGMDWLRRREALALMVPSAVDPSAWNIVLNPRHPAFEEVVFEISEEPGDAPASPASEHPAERGLDAAVAMTFPASDPISPTPPDLGTRQPPRDPGSARPC